MENTTETRIEEKLHELAAIAKNEYEDGAFFGFFETDENYKVKYYGRVYQLAAALIKAAQDSDIEKAVFLAAKHIIEQNLNK